MRLCCLRCWCWCHAPRPRHAVTSLTARRRCRACLRPQLVGKRPDGSTYEFQLNHTFNANQINW